MTAAAALTEHQNTGEPYLSVVVTARNDNHGGDLLYRVQLFLDTLAAQCERHALSAELILVEWNPPPDRPRLAEVLRLPEAERLPVRVIEVPHEVHAQLEYSDRLPLFQMIAKNVGIRRARGRFVLASNVDVVFSDELMEQLASRSLSEQHVYRCDRYDVTADIPVAAPLDEQLRICAERVIRINRYDTTLDVRTGEVYRIYPKKLPKDWPLWLVLTFRVFERLGRMVASVPRRLTRFVMRGVHALVRLRRLRYRRRWLQHPDRLRRDLGLLVARIRRWRKRPKKPRTPSPGLLQALLDRWRAFVDHYRLAIEWERARIMLHTNASGDFTLLAREAWQAVRGYPELQLFSMHIDSLLLYEAHYAGFSERYLSGPLYHLEHGSGFRPDEKAVEELNSRLEKAAVAQVTLDQFKEWVTTMFRQDAPIVFNGPEWGFDAMELRETTVPREEVVRA